MKLAVNEFVVKTVTNSIMKKKMSCNDIHIHALYCVIQAKY